MGVPGEASKRLPLSRKVAFSRSKGQSKGWGHCHVIGSVDPLPSVSMIGEDKF